MKKILFLFMMMLATIFASSGSADTLSASGIESSPIGGFGGNTALPSSDVTFVKVDILHGDTLMYSWENNSDTIKIKKVELGDEYKSNKNMQPATIAVVCFSLGEGGV